MVRGDGVWFQRERTERTNITMQTGTRTVTMMRMIFCLRTCAVRGVSLLDFERVFCVRALRVRKFPGRALRFVVFCWFLAFVFMPPL